MRRAIRDDPNDVCTGSCWRRGSERLTRRQVEVKLRDVLPRPPVHREAVAWLFESQVAHDPHGHLEDLGQDRIVLGGQSRESSDGFLRNDQHMHWMRGDRVAKCDHQVRLIYAFHGHQPSRISEAPPHDQTAQSRSRKPEEDGWSSPGHVSTLIGRECRVWDK